ncbi:MAG: hypothetical protein PF501_00725 [Salinisphaera sp.]|jgi:hypothetical protein|nr:hypothetical protein [Salinisphaera sp.]
MVFARRLVDLMLFRCGPQDMPGDQTTLRLSAAAYCILLFVQVMVVAPPLAAAVQAILATSLLGIYVLAILRLRKLPHRFMQTATALYASGAVLTLVMIGPTHAMGPYLQQISQSTNPQSVPTPSSLVALIYLVAGVWGLAIYSHIYRHALSVSILLGVGATVVFEVLLLVIFSLLG